MKIFTTTGYTYSELTDAAKEKVKQWYLYDLDIHNDIFHDDIKQFLYEEFPKSDLKVCYSLSSCQGDGLNIYGKLKLYDFVDKWNVSTKEKSTIIFYINNSIREYTFETNNRYCYSCKFIDRKYINDSISEFIDELQYQCLKNINIPLIEQFFNDLIDYFEKLDKKLENDGYDYLYNVDDVEITEFCEINDYYFTKEGTFIA